jgi:16S rRNA (cytosine967-C5)-methyltransferase
LKFFPNLVKSLAHALHEIFIEDRYADKVVDFMLKNNSKWGSRDRAFIAESTYEIVRNKRFLLHLGQISTIDNLADLYTLIGVYLKNKYSEIPDWVEFKDVSLIENTNFERKIKESYPDWIDDLMLEQLGEELWNKESVAQNQPANLVLRVNTLKTNKDLLIKDLLKLGIEVQQVDNQEDTLVLTKKANLFKNELFMKGHFEIQDGSSQMIAPFLDLKPGMTVIDACAGAGGKALHIAALMENNGKIVAMDLEENKLVELNRRSKRAGVRIINSQVISSPKTIEYLKDSADRLLLDVPCSGLGVLRRNPDAKWKLNPAFIEKIQITQAEILQKYSKMLKKGGILVYATCSILPKENNEQIERFLKENLNFELLEDKKIFASTHHFDGFYMAKLKRNS